MHPGAMEIDNGIDDDCDDMVDEVDPVDPDPVGTDDGAVGDTDVADTAGQDGDASGGCVVGPRRSTRWSWLVLVVAAALRRRRA
ncbi:MAG: hypothetical protein IPK74_04405 [Deltaproteobacteria bacterium]|nr:hypothetical protein [Deltaproteobacteria bacterium]